MRTKWLAVLMMLITIGSWTTHAQAARLQTVTQISPPSGTGIEMGDTQAFVFRIANTSTGSNIGERIYEVRFRINTGSQFSSSTAAPAGWTRTAWSTTSVTFRANSWNSAIPVGTPQDFTIVIVARTTSADVTERLRDVRSRYTLTTSGNFARTGTVTTSNVGSWALRSLSIDDFYITDVSNNRINSLVAGQQFRLVMLVRNISSATQSSIVSSPNPPTAVKTGTVTQSVASTVYSPNPLTLAPGASGTITWTYNTNSADSGTIQFTAFARNSSSSATSVVATSTVLTVGVFVAQINLSRTCAYINQDFNVTMNLTNQLGFAINNVTPTLTPPVGATLVSGPTPASVNVPAASTVNNAFTWVYRFTGGVAGTNYTFSGSASGTAAPPGSGTRTTLVTTSSPIKRGGFEPTVSPADTNVGNTNVELSWVLQNKGCAHANQVRITAPAGWVYSGEAYSEVDQVNPPNPFTGTADNVWIVSGANPVTFTAPAANVLVLTSPVKRGEYSLVFSSVPTVAGMSTFVLRITDVNGDFVDRNVDVTINPFGSGGLNDLQQPRQWREEFR